MALPHQVRLIINYGGTANPVGTTKNVPKTGKVVTHVVLPGESLWIISKKYYGSGSQYMKIYNANKIYIENVAKAHGKSSSNNGYWIYTGEILQIPDVNAVSVANSTPSRSNYDLGEEIAKKATSFSYIDVASGQSDSVSLSMQNIDKEWLGDKMPKCGYGMDVAVDLTNWDKEESSNFNCGFFIIDDITFSGSPLSCVLDGVSVPVLDDFKFKQKTRTWEKTTIQNIASEIAKAAGVKLVYECATIQIAEMEQNRQPDSAFLYSLCEKYGLAMKVYNSKIVIFDIVVYEAKKAVISLSENDLLSWQYNTTIDGTYTGVELNYTNPDNDKTINVTMGTKGRMYSLNTQASDRNDAKLQAAAKFNEANRSIETMTISIRANINIVASQCINITGLGKASGKYFVDKIKHSIENGYKMQLTLHKVQKPLSDVTLMHDIK